MEIPPNVNRSKMQLMEQEFRDLTHKVDDIHRILLGSEHDKEVGILHRIKNTETRIKSLEDWKSKITYVAFGMSIPATYGVFDIIKTILSSFGKL